MAASLIPPYAVILPTAPGARTIEDYSHQEIVEIEKRMRPGQYSIEGFLAENEALGTVCGRDWARLHIRDITCDHVGDKLVDIIEKAEAHAEKNVDALVRVSEKFLVKGAGRVSCGYQACPFGDKFGSCFRGKQDYVITNIKSQKSISVSSMAIHLIRQHGFFEGSTSYRVDPDLACDVLELVPGKYKRQIEDVWLPCNVRILEDAQVKVLIRDAKLCQQLTSLSTAYLVPFENWEMAGEAYLKQILERQTGSKQVNDFCHVVTQVSEKSRMDLIETAFANRTLKYNAISGSVSIFKMAHKIQATFDDDDEKVAASQ